MRILPRQRRLSHAGARRTAMRTDAVLFWPDAPTALRAVCPARSRPPTFRCCSNAASTPALNSTAFIATRTRVRAVREAEAIYVGGGNTVSLTRRPLPLRPT